MKKGFTLTEFLVYTVLLSGVVFIGALTVNSIIRSGGAGEARAEVNVAVKEVLDKISQDVREATEITTPPAGFSSGSLVLTINGDTITYARVYDQANPSNKDYPDFGKILRLVNGVQEIITSDTVRATGLNFEHISNVNVDTLKVATSIRAEVEIEYASDIPSLSHSEKSSVTISPSRLADFPTRQAPPPQGYSQGYYYGQSSYDGGLVIPPPSPMEIK